MKPNKNEIDTSKTEHATGDKETYGDASDLDVTHYMGNNENIPRENPEDEEEDKEIGQVAFGNMESSNEQSESSGSV